MGPLCGVCKNGFYSNGYVCESCGGTVVSLVVFVVVVVVLFIAIFLIFKFVERTKIFEAVSLLVNTAKVKILYVTSQIVGSVSWATGVTWPDPFNSLSRLVGTIASPFEVIPVECITNQHNFFGYMLVMTLGPVALALLLLLVSRKQLGGHLTQSNALAGIIMISFLVLPSTSLVLFRFFVCTEMRNGEMFLDADLSISCEGESYRLELLYTWLMILVYPLGIPSFYFVVLFRQVGHGTRLF